MQPPIQSILTLLSELAVTVAVMIIIWRAFTRGQFMRWLALAVIAYEILFNVSYMLSREGVESRSVVYNPYTTGLAIFHGTFSLFMFAALIVFFLVAAARYRRGENYFLSRKGLTLTFVILWFVSILSGIALFASLYRF